MWFRLQIRICQRVTQQKSQKLRKGASSYENAKRKNGYKHCYHKKPCAGCLNSDKGKPEHCRKCKIKNCIKEKSLSYCFECAKYPCSLIKNLEKSYNKRYQASLIENSRFVQAHGLEHFMEQQKAKYICPKCGGIISIHDKECSECQEKIK